MQLVALLLQLVLLLRLPALLLLALLVLLEVGCTAWNAAGGAARSEPFAAKLMHSAANPAPATPSQADFTVWTASQYPVYSC
jgi:hypothetical protein